MLDYTIISSSMLMFIGVGNGGVGDVVDLDLI
jgi:hypothetical protein